MQISARIFFVTLFLVLADCSSRPKAADVAGTAPVAVDTAKASKNEPVSVILPPAAAVEPAQPTSQDHSQASPKEAAVAPAKSAHEVSKGVPAEQAFKWMVNGNKRFMKHNLRKDGQGNKDIERLVSGQHPHTIVLSCSDSRVPPEVVFDQKLGEIFVVRTAGEALDPDVIASIEYAVAHLGPKLILVMGHTYCGAVKAAIETINGGDAGSPSLNHLVADIQPRIRATLAKGPVEKDAANTSWANAKGIVEDLKKRSAILQDAVTKGELEIRPALYHLDSGAVHFE